MNNIVVCRHCGARNRIKTDAAGKIPVCGKCRNRLPKAGAPAKAIDLDDRSFDREISSPIPVLVGCWAKWCAACRQVLPVLDELARKYGGRVKIARLDIEKNPSVASRFNVLSVPTLLFFKNGRLVDTAVGALTGMEIERRISAIR